MQMTKARQTMPGSDALFVRSYKEEATGHTVVIYEIDDVAHGLGSFDWECQDCAGSKRDGSFWSARYAEDAADEFHIEQEQGL